MKKGRSETVLFALMGTSPAVLTETVWALANESPSVLPDKVIVITTRAGKDRIVSELLDDGIWNKLRNDVVPVECRTDKLKFGNSAHYIRLLPDSGGSKDLEDVATESDVISAGDCMLQSLRSFTESETTRLVVSIAGGRKTMTCLLTSCTIMLARSHDRLCHVLVDPPFDSGMLEPSFYYPGLSTTHRNMMDGEIYKSCKARLRLVNIPFVRLRDVQWSPQDLPATYPQMVEATQSRLKEVVFPEVKIDSRKGRLVIDRRQISLSGYEFGVMYCLLKHVVGNRDTIGDWRDLTDRTENLQGLKSGNMPAWLKEFQRSPSSPESADDIRKAASRIRGKLKKGGVSTVVADRLVSSPRGPAEVYPVERIQIVEFDVC